MFGKKDDKIQSVGNEVSAAPRAFNYETVLISGMRSGSDIEHYVNKAIAERPLARLVHVMPIAEEAQTESKRGATRGALLIFETVN